VFAKIVALILSLGIIACALLAVRQARVQAFHELTQTRLRIRTQDEQLWKLRAAIAARVIPEHVHEMAASISELKPVVGDGGPRPGPLHAGPGVLYDDLGRPLGGEPEVLTHAPGRDHSGPAR